ncbi:MAG TPA: sugar ABC transporter permease [Clostridiaceae bacterium]|nr:sugar ABC transporter permease [Clostridiaceae bacterium]
MAQISSSKVSGNKKKETLKKDLVAYSMLFPGMLIFLVFVFIPFLQTIVISFTDWNGLNAPKFIGLQNYIELFTSNTSKFYIALKNNLFWMVLGTAVPVIIGIFQANILVGHRIKSSNVWQMIFFMPQILSVTVTCLIWTWLYEPTNGPINAFLDLIGAGFLKSSWLGDPKLVMWSLLGIYIWLTYGFDTVVFCAAIQGVNPQLYEASTIDGCSLRKQFWHITLPSIRGTLVTTILLQIISSFKVLDVVFITTKGGPGYNSYILSYYAYNEGIQSGRVGYSASISIALAILLFSVSMAYNRAAERIDMQ